MRNKWRKVYIYVIVLSTIGFIFSSFTTSSFENHEKNIYIAHYHDSDYIDNWYIQPEHPNYSLLNRVDFSNVKLGNNNTENNENTQIINDVLYDPMDSAWSMLSHNVKHTGKSQYNTTNNPGAEIWRVRGDTNGEVWSSTIIDKDGVVYFGTTGSDHSLYAMYPNGTRKWRFHATDLIWGTPAISEDGVIYFTTWGQYFFAVNPNGTERWRFKQDMISTSSCNIGNDGTIYFGTDGHTIFAVTPNGIERWRYTTGSYVNGGAAISEDGTIYIGSSDRNLYALNPNGTLLWQFHTGGEIKGSPTIAPDGTIYVPSFGGYFYALYPNGTMKWKAPTGGIVASAGFALAEDGTIYVGTEILRAYYPDGTLKWSIDVQGDVYGTVPAVSSDGTIYVSAAGSIVAVNPDGTERWRKYLTDAQIRSSPSIGPDGRVYVGSGDPGIFPYGHLHAFGLGPLYAEAGGPYSGTALLPVTLTGLAFGGIPPYQYLWDFGDGNGSIEINPTHTFTTAGNYTAIFTVTDSEGNSSSDTVTVTMDYPLPTLVITRPTNAFYLANKQLIPLSLPFIIGKITIKANVTDYYQITRVEFIIHGEIQYTDTTAPYEWTWIQRNYRLRDNIYIIAYDSQGRYADNDIDVIKWF